LETDVVKIEPDPYGTIFWQREISTVEEKPRQCCRKSHDHQRVKGGWRFSTKEEENGKKTEKEGEIRVEKSLVDWILDRFVGEEKRRQQENKSERLDNRSEKNILKISGHCRLKLPKVGGEEG
jgi:hypothetical protein